VIYDAIAAHDEPRAHQEMERLETLYLAAMRTQFPVEIRKVISWADAIA
jgi:hypothetical protein